MKDLFESLKFTAGMALVLLVLIFVLPPLETSAQPQNCAPRAHVIQRLAEKYAETRQSIGMGQQGMVMETFASEAGSWTITITTPQGMTCLIASGESFERLAEALPEAEEDA